MRVRSDPARRAAYDVLRAVDERGAYANLVLPGLLRERGITGRDAALATELAYGALRSIGTLDAVLAACSSRPLDDVDSPLRDVLRLGSYQLLHTRVPPHAAVSTSVDLARLVASAGPVGFANAVLRRVSERTLEQWLDVLAPPYDADPVGHLALVHAHPRWVVTALRDALGGSLEQTAAALAANNARPLVHLVARPGQMSRAELVEQVGDAAAPGPWSPYAVRLGEGDPGALAAIRAGRAGVQDEGSQLAALALVAAPLDGPDQRWLDMCAGPGGKAALLASLAAPRGVQLLAADRAGHRARLARQAVGGARPEGSGGETGSAWTVVADGTMPAWRARSFDRVLVDAPCSGLGALRRRPEARWRRQPADLPGLRRLQCDLLLAGLDALRPGGVLAYVVCSPHLAETSVIVGDALRARPGTTPLDARPLLPGLPYLGPGPAVQLWPHRHATDAMFIALLRRVAPLRP